MPKKKNTDENKTSEKKTKADKKNLEVVENSELEALQAENAELKDQLMRALAEAENIRKRSQRDIEDASKFAINGFARDLLDVLDNLYRSEENISTEEIESNPVLKNISDGVSMTKSELLKAFSKNGIERISPMGEQFDHNFHQAVVQVESDEAEPGEVVQVIQAGYKIKDRLLRPAMVGVAKAAAKNQSA